MEKFYKAARCTEEELKNGEYGYKKAKGKLQGGIYLKGGRDEDGFFIPSDVGPVKHYGIVCGALGITPLNRKTDIEYNISSIMKEAYEHDIESMMCDVRFTEYRFLQKFAQEDLESDCEKGIKPYRGIVGTGKSRFNDTIKCDPKRRRLIDSVTWKYKWIQLYKKPCFLFAQYTIEELCNWNGINRVLKTLPAEQQDFILSSAFAYDPEKGKCVFEGDPQTDEEKLWRCNASLYWSTFERHKECERFREDFIHSYNKLPEPNKRMMNAMYERAWCVLSFYKYGKQRGHIPMPWYDKKEEATKDTEKVPDKAEGGI